MLLVLLCPDGSDSGTDWLFVVLFLLTNVVIVVVGWVVECYSAHRRSDYEWPAPMVRDDRYANLICIFLHGNLETIIMQWGR
jgi:hypothetical protein